MVWCFYWIYDSNFASCLNNSRNSDLQPHDRRTTGCMVNADNAHDDTKRRTEFAYGLRHIRTVPHMYFVYKHKTPLRTKLVSFGWITTIIIRYVCIFALVVELKTQRPRGMYDLYVYFIYYTQRNTMKRNRNKLRWEWRATIPWILVAWITILSMEYRHQIFSERSSPKSTTNL